MPSTILRLKFKNKQPKAIPRPSYVKLVELNWFNDQGDLNVNKNPLYFRIPGNEKGGILDK